MSDTASGTLRRDAPATGIALLATGVTVFACQDVIIKLLSGGYPIHEMLLIRSLTGLPLILAVAWWQHDPAAFRVHRLALLRGFIHFLSFTCYYLALTALPLAETATLYYASPLFITALSVPLLGETVGPRRWGAVLVGFVGVIIVLRPDASAIRPAMLLALAAAFFYALAQIVTRRGGRAIPATGFALHSMLILTVCSGLSGLILGDGHLSAGGDPSAAFLLRAWSVPPIGDLLLLALNGPISAVGFLLLTQAYRIAPASIVTPFEFSSLPVAVLFGYIFWRNLPAPSTWLGLAFIVGAGLYIVRREAVKGRKIVRGWPPMRPRL